MPKVTKPRSYFRQYIIKNDNDEDICKFCLTKFGKNITRIKDHFIQKCKSLPTDLKPNTDNQNVEDERPNSSLSNFSTTSNKSNKSIPELFEEENRKNQEIEEKLARAIFSLNLAFNCVDNPEFRDFINFVAPNFKIPSRKKLSTTLLENEYQKALKKRKELLELSVGQSVVIDAWTNERNESIFDVMICTPEPVFLKTIET